MKPQTLLTLGESMAALRATRPVRLGGTLELSIAGSETNVAIGVARLGHRARWAGAVGDDEFGALIRRTLRAEGVDTDAVRVAGGEPTGMIIFEPRLEDVTRVTYRRRDSAGSRLAPADVERAFADPPAMLHITGITAALSPTCRDAIWSAVTLAAEHHTRICMDVNYRAALWSRRDAAAVLAPLARHAHVLFASEDELDLVSGATDEPAQARELLGDGVDQVVVTRGAAGATAYTRDGRVERDAPAANCVDPVGAGDAFVAGYLAATLDGQDVNGCMELAVRVAAFAVSFHGDWEGLPDRDELTLLGQPSGATLR